jgi:drug/metabolite transporter (DMT)-like permease
MQFAQPFLGLLIAVALLGEPATLPMLLAGGLIVAGVAVAQSRISR